RPPTLTFLSGQAFQALSPGTQQWPENAPAGLVGSENPIVGGGRNKKLQHEGCHFVS
ncbi:hypothetical protein P7K49_029930, partial [Saguinus oedipus]